MNVEIYDQYRNVLNEDGTLLHNSESSSSVQGTFSTAAEAVHKVTELYEQSKALGTHADRIVDLSKGYAELLITFPDKRKLNRVIYTNPPLTA